MEDDQDNNNTMTITIPKQETRIISIPEITTMEADKEAANMAERASRLKTFISCVIPIYIGQNLPKEYQEYIDSQKH